MAKTDQIFQASSYQDLVNQVNAFIASKANTLKIYKWVLAANNVPKYVGIEWFALLTWDIGGTALSGPFLLNILQENTAEALETSMAAYRTTYAADFLSGAAFDTIPSDNPVSRKVWAAFIRNTDAANADDNYLIES